MCTSNSHAYYKSSYNWRQSHHSRNTCCCEERRSYNSFDSPFRSPAIARASSTMAVFASVAIPSTAPSDLQLLREHHLLWLFLPALHDIIHQREKRVALHYSVRLDVIRKTSKLWILLEGLPVSILQDTLVDIHCLEYIYSDRRPEGHWMNLCLYLYDLRRRRRHLHSPLLLKQNPYSRIHYFHYSCTMDQLWYHVCVLLS